MGGRDQLRVDDAEALILSVTIMCILRERKCNYCAIYVLLISSTKYSDRHSQMTQCGMRSSDVDEFPNFR